MTLDPSSLDFTGLEETDPGDEPQSPYHDPYATEAPPGTGTVVSVKVCFYAYYSGVPARAFEATVSTNGNPYQLAARLAESSHNDLNVWIIRQVNAARARRGLRHALLPSLFRKDDSPSPSEVMLDATVRIDGVERFKVRMEGGVGNEPYNALNALSTAARNQLRNQLWDLSIGWEKTGR